MFFDRFENLCKQKGVSKQKACIDCGLSRTAWNKWKAGAIPNGDAIQSLADYFGVTTDYLLTGEETKKAPDLTDKDRRDIERRLSAMIADLSGPTDGLMFDGEPIDDETRQLLEVSLRNQLEISKRIAKQKFTPKKYRKEGE